jgi:UMF1 family MFS transporter
LGLGIAFTLILPVVGTGDWLMCLILYVCARIGFAGANLFYDAFLVDVTAKERMDWVSSCGYAWGYIGGTVPFIAVIVMIVLGMHAGNATTIPVLPTKIGFIIVAVWWLLFSIPLIKNVSQIHYIEADEHPVRESFVRLFQTFREIKKYRNTFMFLVAYFFYIDGVDTIITMATSYGRDVGLGVNMLILAILMIQIVAFPCALVYGKLAEKFSAKTMLYAGIIIYSFITLGGFFLPSLPSLQMKIFTFWVLAFLVATSQGGIQALSRSFFAKLIPAEKSAEFFGFYNIFGKFATIAGPFLMGAIGRASGDSRYGILSILILFIVGGIMLRNVESEKE